MNRLDEKGLAATTKYVQSILCLDDKPEDAAIIANGVITAYLAATSQDEGWRLVPVEPTPEMLGAWYRYKNGHRWPGEEPARDTSDVGAYEAMLAAAPRPPEGADK